MPRKRVKRRGASCVVPPAMPLEEMSEFVLQQSDHEQRAVAEYVELEAEEKVLHAEKVKSERVFGQVHDCWDIATDKGRWWVITSPTNLYSQELFPSLDYTISFHVGVMARVAARQRTSEPEQNRRRLGTVWRKWLQAAESTESAEEPEEFQTIGLKCRECMVALVREIGRDDMVPCGQERPKKADVVNWSVVIAGALCPGSHNEQTRDYLKQVSKATWNYVNWLTHAANATRFDSMIAIEATENVITALSRLLAKFESGAPERCPNCSSYKVEQYFEPEQGTKSGYVIVCGACGWNDAVKRQRGRARRDPSYN